jgi:phospholipase C
MYTVTLKGNTYLIPNWAMNDKDDDTRNTHLWIVNRSLEMVYRESARLNEPFGARLQQFLGNNLAMMHQGLWDADNKAPYNDPVLGQATYMSHFYDPDTEENYLGFRSPTALTQGAVYFQQALSAYWSGAMDQAAYNLGLALHYVTDVGQPMHAANFINVFNYPPKYHEDFEQYVVEWTNANPPPAIPYSGNILSAAPGDFIKEAARRAKAREGDLVNLQAVLAYKTHFEAQWHELISPAIDGALKDIRDVTSQYLTLWMRLALSAQPGTWVHINLTSATEAPAAAGGLLTGFYDPAGTGTERIVTEDLDGHIHHLGAPQGAPESWAQIDLTNWINANNSQPPYVKVPAGAAPVLAGYASPVPWASRQIEFTDARGNLYELTGSPGVQWFCRSITALTPSAVIETPAFAALYAAHDRMDVFVKADGTIWCSEITDGGGYTQTNLTQAAGAPAAQQNLLSAAYGSTPHTYEAIAFLDVNAHAGLLFRVSGDPWKYVDLTAATQAPGADGKAVACIVSDWQEGSVPAVTYSGVDGHLHEIVCRPGAITHTDITAAADAPAVTVRTLVGYGDDEARRIAYVDSDGGLNTLTLAYGGQWEYTALSEEASCPPAASQGLAGYTFISSQGRVHRILYLDGNGNVQSVHQVLGFGSAAERRRASNTAAVGELVAAG